jgi:hypothetical protein
MKITRNYPHQNVLVSQISTSNELLLYKAILKPIWTCRIQLLCTSYNSNIKILQCFQSKALRIIMDAPWYIPNMVFRRDLQTSTLKEEICHYSSQHSAHLIPNNPVMNFMGNRKTRGDCEDTCQMICLPDS